MVFAKKNQTKNIAGDTYTSQVESFTHGRVYDIIVSKEFLKPEDRILIIDDFLANGAALLGLSQLVRDAGATLIGAGIVIEKGFQQGATGCAPRASASNPSPSSSRWTKRGISSFAAAASGLKTRAAGPSAVFGRGKPRI